MASGPLHVPDTQPYKTISVTAGQNVVIDANKSFKQGKYGIIAVKGHATATLSNAVLFSFSSGGETARATEIFVLGIGTEWDVTDVGYGFMSSSTIAGRVPSGKYFHVNIPVIFE